MQESSEVTALRRLTDDVRRLVDEASRQGPSPDLRHLVGYRQIVGCMKALEPGARRTVWNLQPRIYFDPDDPGIDLTAESEARGVRTQLVTRATTPRLNPLIGCLYPTTRIAPVFVRALVLDEERALVEGLDTVEGDPTAWVTHRPSIVAAVLELWHRTLALSTPLLPPGTEPALTPRQVRVARLVAVGEKDQTIARMLDTSARTVERDVRAVLSFLGARSRTEAVLVMRGRDLHDPPGS